MAVAISVLVACEKETPPSPSSEQAPPATPPPAVPARPPPAAETSTSFSVVGVADGDALNMRSAPDATSTIVGSIPPNTSGIAGVAAPTQVGQTHWQRVSYGGVVGWVNARFLRADGSPGSAPNESPNTAAPSTTASSATREQLAALEHLICFGNEPFWAVQFKPDGSATCEAMCEGPPGLRVVNVTLTPAGDPQGFDLLDAQGSVFLRGVMRKTGKCSDGMSDNVHPYVFSSTGKPGPFEGCCRDRRVKLPFG